MQRQITKNYMRPGRDLQRICGFGMRIADVRNKYSISGRREGLSEYVRRVGMTDKTDLHVGKRLRRRRRLLGMTQQDLAGMVGVRFQQIQKYECGANRVTSSRLYELSRALNVSVQYFFDGLETEDMQGLAANDAERLDADILSQKETLELVRAYYRLGERPRRRLLELAKALETEATESGAA
jgi:transcriptional regulator with XRE-family HTH domain